MPYTQYPAFDAADWFELTNVTLTPSQVASANFGAASAARMYLDSDTGSSYDQYLKVVIYWEKSAPGSDAILSLQDNLSTSINVSASANRFFVRGGVPGVNYYTAYDDDFYNFPSMITFERFPTTAKITVVCNGKSYTAQVPDCGVVNIAQPSLNFTNSALQYQAIMLSMLRIGSTGTDTDETTIDPANSCFIGSKYTYYPDFYISDFDSPPAGILFGPQEVLIPAGSTLNKDFLSTDSDNYFQAKIRVDTSAVANGSFKVLMFFQGHVQAVVQILTTAFAAQFKVYTNSGASSVVSSAAGEYSSETVYLTLKINMVTREITLDIEAPLLSETLSLTGVTQSPVSPFVEISNPNTGTTGYARLLEYYSVGSTGVSDCLLEPPVVPDVCPVFSDPRGVLDYLVYQFKQCAFYIPETAEISQVVVKNDTSGTVYPGKDAFSNALNYINYLVYQFKRTDPDPVRTRIVQIGFGTTGDRIIESGIGVTGSRIKESGYA